MWHLAEDPAVLSDKEYSLVSAADTLHGRVDKTYIRTRLLVENKPTIEKIGHILGQKKEKVVELEKEAC